MMNSELEEQVVGYIRANYAPDRQERLLIALEHTKLMESRDELYKPKS